MSEVLLVNPRRRRKRNSHRRRARKSRRRHVARINPHRRRRRNPHFRFHRRRRRRNPSFLSGGSGFVGNLTSQGKEGLLGAVGALGLDLAWGYGSAYLPATISTPSVPGSPNYFGLLAKALGAVLIGMVGGKVMPGKGRTLAVGAMTVVIHDTLKGMLQQAMPSLPLSGVGAYVGTSPIVAYGAPAVGVPQLGTGMRGYPQNYALLRTSSGIPNADAMGAYTSVGGFIDGADGTEW